MSPDSPKTIYGKKVRQCLGRIFSHQENDKFPTGDANDQKQGVAQEISQVFFSDKKFRNQDAQVHKKDNHGRKERHIETHHVPQVKLVCHGSRRVKNQNQRENQDKKPDQNRHSIRWHRIKLDAFVLDQGDNLAFATIKPSFLQFGQPHSQIAKKEFHSLEY